MEVDFTDFNFSICVIGKRICGNMKISYNLFSLILFFYHKSHKRKKLILN